MDACLENLRQAQCDFLPCFSHDKPIPDAQNYITEKALDSSAEWFWYLEEDVIPPPNALRAMLPEAKVISARYCNRGGTWCYSLDSTGRLQYAGMGCLLVHRAVFSRLKTPFFCSSYEWTWIEGQPIARRVEPTYGRQDVHFFASLWKEGIQARLANVVCEHANVVNYHPYEIKENAGCHEIELVKKDS
jgi:hypothetical protein